MFQLAAAWVALWRARDLQYRCGRGLHEPPRHNDRDVFDHGDGPLFGRPHLVLVPALGGLRGERTETAGPLKTKGGAMYLLIVLGLFGLHSPGLPGVDAKPLGQYAQAWDCWSLAAKLDAGQGHETHVHKRHVCILLPIPIEEKR